MEKELLGETELDQISGGSLEETREIAEFINAHGGSVSYGETMKDEVNAWLRAHHTEIGITRASFSKWSYEQNVYGLKDAAGNSVISYQNELMKRLREVYSD